MESPGSGPLDCGVGSIVWVRRRNGSWWPGKILASDELSTCHLTSPRSGTPVKLLGREDASVDWYNLEKSKRVKAFRCGEFNDCIERAESSHGVPIKKREKYARREDAILHALELEKQMLREEGNINLSFDHTRSIQSGSVKESSPSSEDARNTNGKRGTAKSAKVPKELHTFAKDEAIESLSFSLKAKDGDRPSREVGSEAIPRMRGLQEFGLRTSTASLKQKASSSVSSDGPHKRRADDRSQSPSASVPGMEGSDHVNESEQKQSFFRAKRSKCVYLPESSSDSLNYKEVHPGYIERTPLVEDAEGYPNPDFLSKKKCDESMEDDESDTTESDVSRSEFDSSGTEPDITRLAVHSGSNAPTVAEMNFLGEQSTALAEHRATSSEEPDESEVSGDMSHLYPDDPLFGNEAVSKWQLKGKRNIRNSTKKSSVYKTPYGTRQSGLREQVAEQKLRFDRGDDLEDGIDDVNFNETGFGAQMIGFPNSQSRKVVDHGAMTWDDCTPWKDQWEDIERFDQVFCNRHGRTTSMLFDVDLKVQASYQKERVPIVSLMSKLNGKAIIGHPIQVEVLEDGSTDILVDTSDCLGHGTSDYDGNTAIPQGWRTAARSKSRVPRVQDQKSRLVFKKSNAGHVSENTNAVVKTSSIGRSSQASVDRKSGRKTSKKVNSSWCNQNQKTRTLSSIGTKPNSNNCVLKPETPIVACIPAKLVFSRLLEKISRPPLKGVVSKINGDA